MRTILKGAAMLAAVTILLCKRKSRNANIAHDESRSRGLWRKTPPNPGSYDKYGDMG